ncbi:MAG: hypothetical protein ABI130_12670 [Leifsonia sp.]
MFTATRPARTRNAEFDGASFSEGLNMDRSSRSHPELARLVERHGLPLVVLDIGRAARQYRSLREAFPAVDVSFDVSALAHPALISAIDAEGGSFAVAHDGVLSALTTAGADLSKVLHATSVTHPHEVLAAYNAGVRRFVVDGARDLEKFAGHPADLRLIVRLRPELSPQLGPRAAHLLPRGVRPEDAPALVGFGASLGVRVAGFSLRLPEVATPQQYVAAIARTIGLMADIETATRIRFDTLDLGDNFPGRAARRATDRSELDKAIRAIVAPGTSHVNVTATAGRAVTNGCITIVAGTIERDVDPLLASECIDDGASVAVVGAPETVTASARAPFFRVPSFRVLAHTPNPVHRILRRGDRRGPQTGSAAG